MKNIQKSVRMTEEIFKVVDSYRGDGFNDKLANLLTDYLHGQEQLRRDLDTYQKLVDMKRDELRRIQDRVREAQVVERRLGPLLDAVADLLGAE